jgi:hypothetical protein
MLIDQFIVGVGHDHVRKQILDYDPDKLTLEICLNYSRTYEATASQAQQFQPQPVSQVSYVKRQQHGKRKPAPAQPSQPSRPHGQQSKPRKEGKCMFCGKEKHPRSNCPASGSTCSKCHKTGHWAVACLGTKPKQQGIHEVQQYDARYDEYEDPSHSFQNLNFDSIESPDGTQAFATIKIERLPGQCANLSGKIDTGSQGNILPVRTFAKMYPDRMSEAGTPMKITPCDTILTAYNGTRIKQYGYINLECAYKNKASEFKFYIADTPSSVIFGYDLCVNLDIVNLNYSINKVASPISSVKQLEAEFPKCFSGIGKLPGEYHIQLKDNARPIIHAPRSAPIQLRDKIKAELERMEANDVIKRVHEPTDWVSSITYVLKSNGSLRICLDPSDLNKSLKRGQHHIPTLEELTHKFSGAKFFSKLDARSGYWSIRLAESSQLLTTFNTPFGRYCFKRLPFGLSISQDVFQAAMDDGLHDLPGIVSIADDIAVFGSTEEEHDANLRALMKRAQDINMVFNSEKCQIKCDKIPFFGNIYSKDGVQPDPKKVQAIIDLKPPTNVSELQSLLGFVTYLALFIPNLSEHTTPLRKLLLKDNEFQWHHEQQKSFETLKKLICEANTLAYFDKTKPVTLQVDASQQALGAALTQEGKIIAYASKSLNPTEQRYANIDREMLACVFGAERFHTYIFGKHFTIESDHKPLEIISKKPINAASARLQRMLLRLQRYDYNIVYRPGKEMTLPDSLSRMPSTADSKAINLDVQICHIQFSTPRLTELRSATREDPILNQLMSYALNGFPATRRDMHSQTRLYWSFRDEISIDDGILLKGTRIMIPAALTSKFLRDIHTGHLGITKCQQRAKSSVYWPNIDQDILEFVQSCEICQRNQASLPTEQLMPVASDLPNIPWHTLGTDIFTLNGDNYIIISDYMSKFPIVEKLGNDSSSQKIANITSKYITLFGIPHTIISDNGPQFTGKPYQSMIQQYGIAHVTSSPHHARSHGFIERAIRTAKATMKKEPRANDIALLALRTTPIGPQLPTPAELIFGRKIGTNLPIAVSGPRNEALRDHREKSHENLSQKYTRQHPELQIDTPVYFQDVAKRTWSPGTIIGFGPEPRSYTIQDEQTGQQLRRNRELIRPRPQNKANVAPVPRPPLPDPATSMPAPAPSMPAPVRSMPAQVPSKPAPAPPMPEPAPAVQNTTPEAEPSTPVPQPRKRIQLTAPIPTPRSPVVTRSRSNRPVKPPARFIENGCVEIFE